MGVVGSAGGSWRLLGDVGGTNARFALQAGSGMEPEALVQYRCADFESLQAALQHYLAEPGRPQPQHGAIGIANPIDGDQVRMTNHDWQFSIEALRQGLGLKRLLFLNDFAALALALPTLRPDELRPVGGGMAVAGAPLALLGAGTGLGVSGLMPSKAGPDQVISGEGGHVTLAPADDEEAAVVDWLRRRFGHVSAERALSGQGLENLYRAWAALHGHAVEELSAAQISARALQHSDPTCDAALELFLSLLGNVAGNLALTLGALGGVYIGGGIVPRLGARIDDSRFRQRFEQKGRFADYLSRIPVSVIQPGGEPSLRGAARALDA
jgi:glucokinase